MQFGRMEENPNSALQRLNVGVCRLGERYRSAQQIAEQKFYGDSPHYEGRLHLALHRLDCSSRLMEEKYRAAQQVVEQKFYDDNPHFEGRLRLAQHRLDTGSRLMEGNLPSLTQADYYVNKKTTLLETSAPSFSVEAHRPKGGSKPLWMRSLIRNLIGMFAEFQQECTGRKLFKSEFEQFLFDRFPVSKRAIEEIWRQVRGEWQRGGRPEAKTLTAKVSQKELEAHFADFRREFIRDMCN